MQFIVTALVLCITAVGYLHSDRSFAQLLTAVVYICVIFVEVMPCCWFHNQLIAESEYLTTALYSSAWYNQNQQFRKILITFMQRSQKATIIVAASLVPATLQSLLAVSSFLLNNKYMSHKINIFPLTGGKIFIFHVYSSKSSK